MSSTKAAKAAEKRLVDGILGGFNVAQRRANLHPLGHTLALSKLRLHRERSYRPTSTRLLETAKAIDAPSRAMTLPFYVVDAMHAVSTRERRQGLPRARLGLPRRHRRRGALRGHGPLRTRAHPHRLVRPWCSPRCSSATSVRARSSSTIRRRRARASAAALAQVTGKVVDFAFYTHPAGPPVCWCCPPLPRLWLAFAHRHGVEPRATVLCSTSSADRAFGRALGLRIA